MRMFGDGRSITTCKFTSGCFRALIDNVTGLQDHGKNIVSVTVPKTANLTLAGYVRDMGPWVSQWR